MIKNVCLIIVFLCGLISVILFFNVDYKYSAYKYALPFILANYYSFMVFIIYKIDLLVKVIKEFFTNSDSLSGLVIDIVIFITFIIFIIIPFSYLTLLYINVDFANLIMHFFTERTVIEPTTEQKLIFWLSAVLLSISYNYISPKDK